MKERLTLTLAWFVGLVIMLVGVEVGYFQMTSRDGFAYLLPEQRLEVLRPLLYVYGGYLAGIFAFWYLRPFPAPRTDTQARVRFGLALAATLLLNLVLLYFVFRVRLYHSVLANAEVDVLDDIGQGVMVAGWLSFLTAPVNAFYFGMRREATPIPSSA